MLWPLPSPFAMLNASDCCRGTSCAAYLLKQREEGKRGSIELVPAPEEAVLGAEVSSVQHGLSCVFHSMHMCAVHTVHLLADAKVASPLVLYTVGAGGSHCLYPKLL